MGDNLGTIRYLWVAYSQNVAVGWQEFTNSDGETTYETVGTVIYGELRADVLREFPIRRIVAPMPHTHQCVLTATMKYPALDAMEYPSAPEYETKMPPAPSHAEIAQAWDHHTPPPPREVDPTARRVNESKAQFYQRIADAYIEYATTNGKPTLTIAQNANVTKSTAGRWIAEARLLGYLPETKRGRTGR